ncbi:MAG: transporter [Saprospirales bacterium]|nr:transporter [Saprospirales bacterium]MBK8490124.1 transporter [Saprospirales bacterium]
MNLPKSLRKSKLLKEPEDLGFGTRLTESDERLINPDGSFNIDRIGLRSWTPYQSLVEMSWPKFFLVLLSFYSAVNFLFAFLYVLVGVENLAGAEDPALGMDLAEAFFFSVQTLTTVGYGAIHPLGLSANIVASLNALVGLMSFALMTGLFFARFAKPKAQVLFSSSALIAPYQDGWSFQFRIANKRNNQVINLRARMIMSWIEEKGGEKIRRYGQMDLELDQVSFFPLNWTIVHAINEGSPLNNRTQKDLERMNAEFLVLIEGYDETYAQMVHVNRSYSWRELQWHKRFKTMYHSSKGGRIVLDLSQIDELQ